MSLGEKINQDLKQATLDKQDKVLSVLRLLKAAISNKEISLRKGKDISLTNDQVIEVTASEIKKRKEAIIDYQKGNRDDLVKKEKQEIKILEKYLPKQLSDKEIEKIVKEIVKTYDDASQRDFGKIMGQVMPKVKGKAEGNKVSEVVKRILGD